MLLKLQQVLRAAPVLRVWLGDGEIRFPAQTAYKLLVLRDELDKHLSDYQNTVLYVLSKHGKRTDDGFEFKTDDGEIDHAAVAAANTELSELEEAEIEVGGLPAITLDELEAAGVKLSVAELDAVIGWLVIT
jgi:hypothetical protein